MGKISQQITCFFNKLQKKTKKDKRLKDMNQSQCVSYLSLYFLTKKPNMTFQMNKNLNTDRIVDIKSGPRDDFEIPFQDFHRWPSG